MAETRFPRHKKPEDEALWLENLQRQVEHRHAAYEGIGSAAEADHLVEYERLMGDHDVLAMVTQEAIAEDFRRTHDSVRREVADWASGHAAVLDVLERTRPESALPENLYVNAEQLIRRGRELIGKYRHSAAIADSVGKTQATAVSGFEKWIKTGALEADQNAVHGLAALAQ
jgi:hypothetical protein